MDIDIYSSLGPWDSGILWGNLWSGVGGYGIRVCGRGLGFVTSLWLYLLDLWTST